MAEDNKAAKRKSKKKELANLDLVMSGLKTEKERQLARYLQAQIKKTNEAESKTKSLRTDLNTAKQKVEKYEATSKKARDKVYQEQKLRTSAVSEKEQVRKSEFVHCNYAHIRTYIHNTI